MRAFWNGIGLGIAGAGLLMSFFGLIAFMVLSISRAHCLDTGARIGLPVEFTYASGCMGRVAGQWLPLASIVPVERDGKIVFIPKPIVRIEAGK